MTTYYRAEAHEVTDACALVHCHIHHVDEQEKDAFMWCFECGHVYQTARELRAMYRRAILKSLSYNNPWFRSNEWFPSVAKVVWNALTKRAKDIRFCQHCLHDFAWGR